MQKKEQPKRISRRGFIASAAAVGVATTASARRVETASTPSTPSSGRERLTALVERYGSELGRIRSVG